MADDETVVTVEHTDEESAEAPVVVVADTGDDGGNDLEIGAALGALTVTVQQQGEVIAALTERIESLSAQQEVTEQVAETAIDAAIDAQIEVQEAVEEAVEAAEEVAEEAAEDEVEELIEPQREHWMWRKPVKVRRGVDA